MTAATPPSERDPIRSLLRASHHLPADRLGAVVNDRAALLGIREAVVYLADYEAQSLVPVQGPDTPERAPISVEGSVGGRAFRKVQLVRGGTGRIWAPLLDGAERLGVLELVVEGAVSAELEDDCRTFASLIAEIAVTRDAYSDVFARLRRTRPMDMAAEIQWELLPPLTYGTHDVVIAGALEPSYEIGGDTFDYAVNGPVAELMVLDAVGHGLPAALLATAAIGAYRSGRRNELPLRETAALMDRVIAEQFPGSRFATAVLARLELDTGRLHWINAGHPPPLVVRGGHLVRLTPRLSGRPLGLEHVTGQEFEEHLEPGDRVLLYTDGIVEARSPAGEFFGEERLADFVVRAESAGDPPPETLRRLVASVMEHQAGRLQDDATIVLAEWRSGREERLRL